MVQIGGTVVQVINDFTGQVASEGFEPRTLVVIEIKKEVTDVLYREINKQTHAFQSYGLVVQKFWDKIIKDDFIDDEKGKQTHAFGQNVLSRKLQSDS